MIAHKALRRSRLLHVNSEIDERSDAGGVSGIYKYSSDVNEIDTVHN